MRTVLAILTEDSSCACTLTARRRRRRSLPRMYSKEPLEEVAGGGGRGRDSAGHGSITSPTCPEAPCTITTTTYFGWSNGAKQANHATFSSCPRSVACAVPVFPATTQSFKRALPPVPPSSLTTFQRPLRTTSILSGEIS